MRRAIAGDPAAVQIMYGIAGSAALDELVIEWLHGFAESRPVQIGNAASAQLQLDVYGELLDAAHQSAAHGIAHSDFGWRLLKHLLQFLESSWREKDAGFWEARGPSRHFTQSYGTDALDAAALLIPIVGLLPATDPRVEATLEAIKRVLLVDGFLLRNRNALTDVDGLPGGEGVFLACSFWLVEVLAMQGCRDEATALFERLLALHNNAALLSEEYDPVGKQQLGHQEPLRSPDA